MAKHYVETSILKSIINKIYQEIDDRVGSNEFMFIFPCLHIELDNGDTYHFPLGAFSIPQQCSSAYISFNADDVNKFLQENPNFKENVNMFARYLLEKVLTKVFDSFHTPVKIKRIQLSYVNTAHRHPGNFGFSTTDTSREKDNPGILYIRNPEKIKDTYGVDLVFHLPYPTKIDFPEVWVRYFKEPYEYEERSPYIYSTINQQKEDSKIQTISGKSIWTSSYADENRLEPVELINWEQFIPFVEDLVVVNPEDYERETTFFRYSYTGYSWNTFSEQVNEVDSILNTHKTPEGGTVYDFKTATKEINRDSKNIWEKSGYSFDIQQDRKEK